MEIMALGSPSSPKPQLQGLRPLGRPQAQSPACRQGVCLWAAGGWVGALESAAETAASTPRQTLVQRSAPTGSSHPPTPPSPQVPRSGVSGISLAAAQLRARHVSQALVGWGLALEGTVRAAETDLGP